MKDGFHITITTIHVDNDKGEQPNVSYTSLVHILFYQCSTSSLLLQIHNLPPDKLAKRDVVHVDIVTDPVSSGVSDT